MQWLDFDLFLWNIDSLCHEGGELCPLVLLLQVDSEFKVIGDVRKSGILKEERELVGGRPGLGLYLWHRYK